MFKLPRSLPLVLCLAIGAGGATAKTAHHAKAAKETSVAPIDADAFNASSDAPLLKLGSRGNAVARAQILLDRAWFSVGEIDGRFALNMQRIVHAYQLAHGLPPTGTLTPQTWDTLRNEAAPLLTRYTVTDQDASGPFEKIPAGFEARAELKAMPYQSIDEALAERFHASPSFLRALNAGRPYAAGNEIVVPNVLDARAPGKGASIEVEKARHVLYVLDAKKRPLAAFPISFGNERNDPLPIGVMSIKNEVKNPRFTYDPGLMKNAPRDARKVDLAPGPNNPIGNMWLGLSKPHWGIHGTSEPSNVGHSETNGCIHLTNWDAQRVSTLVSAGFRVDVRP